MIKETKTDPKKVLEEIKNGHHKKVKVAVTDIDGILRGKYMHRDKFLSAAEGGFGFCSVVFGWDAVDLVYENSKYTGWHTGYPDVSAQIDLSTHRTVPWDDEIPFFLGDFVDDKGAPLSVCPRSLLKNVIQRAKDSGFEPMVGSEYEWFNFQETPDSWADKGYRDPEPLTPGMFGYSITRASLNQPFFADLMDGMEAFKIPLEGLHTETGPGVIEAAIQVTDALEAADRSVLFKTAAKEIAYRHEILPTFMARWSNELPGCSGHLHQSLWNDGKNVFCDEKAPNKMSETFKSYVAGQLKCLPEILPMYAPNVNSFKRLVEGYWAPTRATWGIDNRTTALRVIPGSSKSTRLETRVPGADMNAYLSISAAIASGLYGIQNKLKLDSDPIEGNAYADTSRPKLPSSLAEAAERMKTSEVANEIFGAYFVDHFVRTRQWEWQESQKVVTDWELKRYFEVI